ncbi:putative Sulfurtransferase [uncultured Desulfobacterium sp.]|uniref:Putative Sulfurtransferase n=1 Tax=uncultured Desulfobacterium sp. TaxID=201089 RepID=A0A445MVN3_9BACT|nr:putative Sulfurtransferase [uncultured Desulfobacterium sp.]
MFIKDIIKELAILLGLAVVTAFAVNALSPKGIALFGEWDTARGVITARPKDDVVARELEMGDFEAVKEIYDSGAAVFVDARSDEDYSRGHIAGAVSLPVSQAEALMDNFKMDYPAYQMIITYCSGRECEDSHILAQLLLDVGYTDVRVFVDGYPCWEKEGYPVEKSNAVPQ